MSEANQCCTKTRGVVGGVVGGVGEYIVGPSIVQHAEGKKAATARRQLPAMPTAMRRTTAVVANNGTTTTRLQTAVAQQNINNNNVILNLIKPPEYIVPLTSGFDRRSQQGHFGWQTIDDVHIPFIYRHDRSRYVALRIVNQNVFPRFFNTIRQEVFDMFLLRSYTMTDLERRLYNEINFFHCDCIYGLNNFQKGEQLVSLEDVLQMYEFLRFVHCRFRQKRQDLSPSYGYMMFNSKQSVVPFFKLNGKHCFPILYFEGDDNYLMKKSKPLTGFAESVLRFLIRLQNVVCNQTELRVITLDEMLNLFEHDTKYTESWVFHENETYTGPMRVNESSILRVKNADPVVPETEQLPQFKLANGFDATPMGMLCATTGRLEEAPRY